VAPGRPRRSRGATRRAYPPEWPTPARTRWKDTGWFGPNSKPEKHLQPTRIGQKFTEGSAGLRSDPRLGPTVPGTGHETSVYDSEDIDLGPTAWWCVDRFGKTPSFPGNFLYRRLKNCLKLNVSLVFLSTRCASVI